MQLIINNTSMQPIYEQIVGQMKQKILNREMKEDEILPSVRTMAKELRISALTVKKAYDALEQEGFIVTIQGKGSFVANINHELSLEEKKKEVEKDMENTIRKAINCGMSNQDIRDVFEIMMEEYK